MVVALAVVPDVTPGPSDQETLALVRSLASEARRAKRPYLERWQRYYRYLRNQAWAGYRQPWLPSPSSSEVWPTIHTLVAWMCDQHPTLTCPPSPDITLFPKGTQPDPEIVAAKALDMQRTLSTWQFTARTPIVSQTVLWDCFTYGTGIFRTGWDPYSSSGLGDPLVMRADPWGILPDPSATSDRDMRYLIEVRDVPLFELYACFPEDRVSRVQPDGPSPDGSELKKPNVMSPEYIPQGMSAATGVTGEWPGTPTTGQNPLFAYQQRGDKDYTRTCRLIEAWVRDTKKFEVPVIRDGRKVGTITKEEPYWRYIAIAGGVVLTPETDNPYPHGQLPYIRVPMAEIGEWWAPSLSEHILPAQVALNRLLAMVQSHAELTGNPIFINPEGSGVERTKITNRPGGIIGSHPGLDPHWLEPPSMGQEVTWGISFWRDTIDRISGISAVARGANLRRRETAGAIDAVQEASFVRIRNVLQNFEEAYRQVCTQAAALYSDNCIEPRTVALLGPQGDPDNFLMLGPRHFQQPVVMPNGRVQDVPLQFQVWVEAGSSLPISRQARASEAMSLYFAGLLDDEAVLEVIDFPNKADVLRRVAKKKEAGLMQEATNPRNR